MQITELIVNLTLKSLKLTPKLVSTVIMVDPRSKYSMHAAKMLGAAEQSNSG
jgi:hypothetical protein